MAERSIPNRDADLGEWYRYLSELKVILGNLNNDVSFVASLLAKEFLLARHRIEGFDVSLKPQSAPGLDIDERTADGERVIAEIKTTIPYGRSDLGAKQKETSRRDFQKLSAEDAAYKYFFVTEERTFRIVRERYLDELEGVTVALLPEALTDSSRVIPLRNRGA